MGVVWFFPVNIMTVFTFICVVGVSRPFFTLWNGIPLSDYTTFYLSVYLLIDVLVGSSFVVSGYYKLSCCEHIFVLRKVVCSLEFVPVAAKVGSYCWCMF